MMIRHVARYWPFAAVLLLASCASDGGVPAEGRLALPPSRAVGFASNAEVGPIAARAHFVEAQELVMGERRVLIRAAELIEELGVVPVAIKLGLTGDGGGAESVYANPAEMNLRLYLEDGTALAPIPASKLGGGERIATWVQRHGLVEADLKSIKDTKERFVFFRLAPRDDFQVGGRGVTHLAGSIQRAVAFDRSLLTFSIQSAGMTHSFYLGTSLVPRLTE